MRSRLTLVAATVAGALSLLALVSGSGDGLRPPAAFADHCAVRPSVSRPVLRSGSSGDQVAVLQIGLLNAGYPSLDPNGTPYIDGLFGSPEAAAVSGFQQSRGLPATGVVDDATWSALDPFIDKTDRHPAPQPPYGQLTGSFNAAAFNNLYPGHPYFGLQAIETGPSAARQLATPYVPPTLLKAIGWIEAGWRQADGGGAPVISFDCGYGVMQITAPGVPLAGINWSMYGRAPEPVYSQVQVPLTSDVNVNVALGAKTLIAKWNLGPEFRPVVGDGNPGIIEDWYYAVWSYNGFVSSNHPDRFNAIYPLRGEYSCNLSDGFNHNRTQFAYQELVFGCIKHPPVLDSVALWSGIPVTLPASVPPFDPAAMDIPTPQPAHGDPTPGTLPPAVVIDAPAGTVAQPFVIAGWAVDYSAPSGTGVDFVQVSAYPSDASGTPVGPPINLGAAALGGRRSDIATVFGNPAFVASGYVLTVRGLAQGYYHLVVTAHSTVTGGWTEAHRVIQVAAGDLPLAGDWNGDGVDTIGVYRPSTRQFHLSDDNRVAVASPTFGDLGDWPLAGDWDGDGVDTIGVYRPATGQFYLSQDNRVPALSVGYGNPGDWPLVGDWDGDGVDTIGVYRPATGQFHLSQDNRVAAVSVTYGNPGDWPLVGDWNGEGVDTIGVYRPATIEFYLRNTNAPGAANVSFPYGNPGDLPVAGDWNGDGTETVGVYRAVAAQFYLRNSNTAGPEKVSATYGSSGDAPVTGDWNGDGVDTIGVYRPSTRQFHLSDDNRVAVASPTFGDLGDWPLAGDWDGDGVDTIGVYRPATGQFYLSQDNRVPALSVGYGNPGDWPLVGDWDGDGVDTIGVYRPATGQFHLSQDNRVAAVSVTYGNLGDWPLVGDWNGDGVDTIGVYRPATIEFYLRNTNGPGAANVSFPYGNPGDLPVAGDWNGDGTETVGVYRAVAAQFHLRNSDIPGPDTLTVSYGNPVGYPSTSG